MRERKLSLSQSYWLIALLTSGAKGTTATVYKIKNRPVFTITGRFNCFMELCMFYISFKSCSVINTVAVAESATVKSPFSHKERTIATTVPVKAEMRFPVE